VFPLGGKAAVLGDDGPAIGHLADGRLAGIDHRLDGEDHARLQLRAGAGLAVVQDLRVFVEFLADAVAAKFADHGEAILFGVFLDDGADIAEMRPGLDH
jgi:hypothetical protein